MKLDGFLIEMLYFFLFFYQSITHKQLNINVLVYMHIVPIFFLIASGFICKIKRGKKRKEQSRKMISQQNKNI